MHNATMTMNSCVRYHAQQAHTDLITSPMAACCSGSWSSRSSTCCSMAHSADPTVAVQASLAPAAEPCLPSANTACDALCAGAWPCVATRRRAPVASSTPGSTAQTWRTQATHQMAAGPPPQSHTLPWRCKLPCLPPHALLYAQLMSVMGLHTVLPASSGKAGCFACWVSPITAALKAV